MLILEDLPKPGTKLIGFSGEPLFAVALDHRTENSGIEMTITSRIEQVAPNRPLSLDEQGLDAINFFICTYAEGAEFSWRSESTLNEEPAHMKEYVYFIRDEDGYVKIGKARNVKTRLSQLQTSSRQELTLLKPVPGGHVAERILHAKFSHIHVRGEWFKPTPELYYYIYSVEVV